MYSAKDELHEAIGRGVINLLNFILKNPGASQFKPKEISKIVFIELGKFYLETPLNGFKQIPLGFNKELKDALVFHDASFSGNPKFISTAKDTLINNCVTEIFSTTSRHLKIKSHRQQRMLVMLLPVYVFSYAASFLSKGSQDNDVEQTNFFRKYKCLGRDYENSATLIDLKVLLNEAVMCLKDYGFTETHEKLRYIDVLIQLTELSIHTPNTPVKSRKTQAAIKKLDKSSSFSAETDAVAASRMSSQLVMMLLNSMVFCVVKNLIFSWVYDLENADRMKLIATKEIGTQIVTTLKRFGIGCAKLDGNDNNSTIILAKINERLPALTQAVNRLMLEMDGMAISDDKETSEERLSRLYGAIGRGVINYFNEDAKKIGLPSFLPDKISSEAYQMLGKFILDTPVDSVYTIPAALFDVLQEALPSIFSGGEKFEKKDKEDYITKLFKELLVAKDDALSTIDQINKKLWAKMFNPLHIFCFAIAELQKANVSENQLQNFYENKSILSEKSMSDPQWVMAYLNLQKQMGEVAQYFFSYGLPETHPRFTALRADFASMGGIQDTLAPQHIPPRLRGDFLGSEGKAKNTTPSAKASKTNAGSASNGAKPEIDKFLNGNKSIRPIKQ